MSDRRGTDFATEQRQLRPREENDSVGGWLEGLFDASVDVSVFALPTFLWAVFHLDVESVLVALAAAAALALTLSGVRTGRFGPDHDWPKLTPSGAIERVVYYNGVLVVAVFVADAFSLLGVPRVAAPAWTTEPVVVPTLGACLFAAAAGVAYPRVRLVWRRLVRSM